MAPVARKDLALWRDVAGAVLREARRRRGERLADVAARARVSPQYLSEVERGRKEPSSEVLAAVAGALDLTLADVTRRVTLVLDAQRRRHLSVVDGAAHRGSLQEAVRGQATARRPNAVLLAA